VKTGCGEGFMKSLHQFMHDKKLSLAVRFDANNLSKSGLELKQRRGGLFAMLCYLSRSILLDGFSS